NSRELLGIDLEETRTQMERRGLPTDGLSDEDIQNMMRMFGEMFRDSAPLTAEQAATIILDGVRAGKWRILVGDDADAIDEACGRAHARAEGGVGRSLDTIPGQYAAGLARPGGGGPAVVRAGRCDLSAAAATVIIARRRFGIPAARCRRRELLLTGG